MGKIQTERRKGKTLKKTGDVTWTENSDYHSGRARRSDRPGPQSRAFSGMCAVDLSALILRLN